ncbi:MAG: hypothetical protein ACYC4K_07340 [Thiobacillus sp.]
MYKGKLNELAGHGEFNQIQFVIQQLLAKTHIAALVMVMGSSNSGSVSPVGTVNVTPLVNMTDGFGNSIKHGVIYSIPYFRLQGGANAIILDPQVGDIGLAVFAENDHSVVKATKAQGNPGSARCNDWADGMYFGGFLNGTPTQYIQFSSSGIDVVSPTKITCSAPTVEIDATTATVNAANSTVTATASASVISPSISLGASGQTLTGLVTSAMETLFNGHTHTSESAGTATSVPNQLMSSSQITTTVKGG